MPLSAPSTAVWISAVNAVSGSAPPLSFGCRALPSAVSTVNGVAPDLIVYFGDLDWRSVGAVGLGSIHTFENDTGPDEANHDWHGIFMLYDPSTPRAAPNFEDLPVFQ